MARHEQDLKRRANEIFSLCERTYAGFIHETDERAGAEVSKEVAPGALRNATYQRGGFALLVIELQRHVHERRRSLLT